MNILKCIIAAFAFLTALPGPGCVRLDAKHIGRSRAFFPLAGAALGAVFAGLAYALRGHSPLVAGACVTAAAALLTRFLHLDGLADAADAIGSYKRGGEALDVMRDSRTGAFGSAAIAVILILKFAALSAILSSGGFKPVTYVFVFPIAGRWVMAWLIQWFPYARAEGKASCFMDNRPLTDLIFAAALTAAACFYVLDFAGLAAFCACTALAHLFGVWMSRKLGGLTGDTYGAACELTEAALLLYLSLL